MFRKKKPPPTEPRRAPPIPFPMIGEKMEGDAMDHLDIDDADLEDELMDLLGGDGGSGSRPVAKKRAQASVPSNRAAAAFPKVKQQAPVKVDSYASGDEGSDVNEDEIDELEDELKGVLGHHDQKSTSSFESSSALMSEDEARPPPSGSISILELKSRLNAYVDGEKTVKSAGDLAKARRYGRAIKTLHDMIKDVSKGKAVNEEDVPPMIAVNSSSKTGLLESSAQRPVTDVPKKDCDSPQPMSRTTSSSSAPMRAAPLPPRRAPPPPSCVPVEPSTSETLLVDLTPITKQPVDSPKPIISPDDEISRLKQAAVAAKKSGDKAKALELLKKAKELDGKLEDSASVEPCVDISVKPATTSVVKKIDENPNLKAQVPESTATDEPPTPSSVLEALEQRLAKYLAVKSDAETEGNSRKARMYGRIVGQYQEAIRDHKKGRPIPVDELPTPPGFPPIPTGPVKSEALGAPTSSNQGLPAVPSVAVVRVENSDGSYATVEPVPTSNILKEANLKPAPSPISKSPATSRDPSPSIPGQTRVSQQLAIIKQKQHEYKTAALEAKRRGDLAKAKEFLKISRGFDPMIESLEGGLRVDTVNIPSLPDLNEDRNDFILMGREDSILPFNTAALDQLEEILTRQLAMSSEFKDYFHKIGDVISASRFENRAAICRRDLQKLGKIKGSGFSGSQGPKIIQETRKFLIARCNPDLGDDDVEVKVIKGSNYNFTSVKDADTFVKVEFPSSSESPQRDTSKIVKDNVTPEYAMVSRFSINRKARATPRIFGKAMKFEVWKQGGWFRGDQLYGTAVVKLKPLETQCNLHDTYDLMDGRKAVGGNLEIMIRLRNPILKKETEEMTKRWTIVDWDSVAQR